MCGFIVTNIIDGDLAQANHFVGRRGPDGTNVEMHDDIAFLHDLLSITGDMTTQPFTDNRYVALFNGEIYNFRDFGDLDSDGKCLIPAFRQHGRAFVNFLDGEFAIVLLDRHDRRLLLYADVFGTKPIHFGVSGGKFVVASYASAIHALGVDNITRLSANSMLEYSLETGELSLTEGIFEFNLDQFKCHFDDWNEAFSSAIGKRSKNTREQIFIGLSSGYDSGAISLELANQGVDFKSFSILGIEDQDIIRGRLELLNRHAETEILDCTGADLDWARHYIENHIEPIRFNIYSSGTGHVERPLLHKDGGALGLTLICRKAATEGRRIYLSGQGADEIFSDYGFGGERFYPHSNFGGNFPEDLHEIFPWASFYGSSQSSYLTKEEYVAGSFGIETRYPFLDKKVVQEFLNLDNSLKNSQYKAPLRHFLEINSFPTAFDKKFGFIPGPKP